MKYAERFFSYFVPNFKKCAKHASKYLNFVKMCLPWSTVDSLTGGRNVLVPMGLPLNLALKNTLTCPFVAYWLI